MVSREELESALTKILSNPIFFRDIGNNQSNTNTVAAKCQPHDQEKYKERVKTYKITNWFAKPPELSPLICSRYGWTCCAPNLLECNLCKKTLLVDISTEDIEAKQNIIKELEKSLINAHHSYCPWKINESPKYFSHIPQTQAFIKDNQKRISSFVANKDELAKVVSSKKFPIIDQNIFKQLMEEEQFVKQFNMLKVDLLPHHNQFNEKIDTMVILSLCGWKFNEKESNSILYCALCQQELALRNFKLQEIYKIDLNQEPIQTTENNLNSENEEMVDDENPKKRQKTENNNKIEILELDPVGQHRFFCPFQTIWKQK